MKTKLTFTALALIAFSSALAQVPTNFTAVTTTLYNSNAVSPGYVFLASCGTPGASGPFFLQSMNNDGSAYAWKKAGNLTPGDNYYPYDFKVLADGRLLNAQYTSFYNWTDGGTVDDQLLDENLNVVETVRMGNRYQA